MSCVVLYEHLGWKPHEGVASVFGQENSSKVSAFHPNQQGHTIEEWIQLKVRICRQIDIGNIPHAWGNNTILTYDQSELIEHTQFVCHYFSPFSGSMLHIYMDFVWNMVLARIHDEDRGFDPVGEEILKPCAYHNATNHSLSRCLSFCYDIEASVNMGKIQVEFVPCGWGGVGKKND